jgi:hypothetical protein
MCGEAFEEASERRVLETYWPIGTYGKCMNAELVSLKERV